MKQLIGCVFLMLMACNFSKEKQTVQKLPYFNSYDLTPEWGAEAKKHHIAPFQFVNQEGQKVTEQDYKGKIYVTHFFFTCCSGICQTLIKNLSILQENFKNDASVKFLSHSVTPEIDSVQKLKDYAEFHNINSKQWNLVTGDKKSIYKQARTSYFADDDFGITQKPSTFIHNENFLLIDPDGCIRGVYNGTLSLEMSRITRHVKLLQEDFFNN